jgi:branched-chain amino acid transport system permease protein
MVYFFQQLLNALQLGSLYALIALGYTLVYGVLSLINFAHGDVFMVGAFLCFLLVTFLGLSFLPALLLTMAGTALLGVMIERLAYKPLRQAPRVSVIITALGVGLILEHLMLLVYPYPQHVPTLLPIRLWHLGGLTLSSLQVIIILASLGLMVALDRLVHRTALGVAMRALSWDRATVSLMGVPVNRVLSITFGIGAALGGAAGVMYSQAYPVIDPYMGVMVGWKAFIAAVIGGIGVIRGAMLGGFILAAVEVLVAAFLPSTYRDVVAFGLLFALLLCRPHGLLGTPRIQKV